ncbi:MAG: hypothetical protein ACK4VZ_13750 [Paracoccaceae bacterium]
MTYERDEAHEADMQALRQEQLADDVGDEPLPDDWFEPFEDWDWD